MRLPLLILVLLFNLTSHSQSLDSLVTKHLRADSLASPASQKLDSIQYSFYHSSDSLKQAYKTKLSALDSTRAGLQHRVDSLKGLQLSTSPYSEKLDSVLQKRNELTGSLNEKMESLKSRAREKTKGLDLPPELQGKASAITQNIDGFKLPVKDLNIPSLDLPGNPLKSLDGLNTAVESPIGKIGEIDGLDGLSGVQENLGDLSSITEQAGAYKDDLKNLTQGNLDEVKELPQALENKAAEAAGVGDLQNQTKALDPLMDAAKSPEAMKEQAIEKVQQEAVNHFAGKEEVLQQAMDKMSKLKSKYASLNSLSDIPKKRPNEMRGKPLVDRLLPGIALQIQKKGDDLLVDFNPYVGYRFSGRLTAGAGWNQRAGYNTDHGTFTSSARIYGPRLYSEYKLGKGFAPRAEAEIMNTFVPTRFQSSPSDFGGREWVPGVFVGLKKDYRFIKSVKGTALVMLRVFNPDHKSPYADVLNVRFGFEFPMKKRPPRPKTEPTEQAAP